MNGIGNGDPVVIICALPGAPTARPQLSAQNTHSLGVEGVRYIFYSPCGRRPAGYRVRVSSLGT